MSDKILKLSQAQTLYEDVRTRLETKASATDLSTKVDKAAIEDAGITAKTYTQLFGGEFTVTTEASQDYISPYSRASVTGRISKHNMHRVTINGTQYILRTRLWYEKQTGMNIKVYEYLGNLNLFISDISGVPGGTDNVPFIIISDLNNSNSIDVLTQTAGAYTIKVEQINNTQKELPKSLIYEDSYSPLEKKNNGGTYNGFSVGVNELLSSRGTLALGYGNKISNDFSILMGVSNISTGNSGIAIGTYNEITGSNSISIGESNEVGTSGRAIGTDLKVEGTNTTVMGRYNVVPKTDFDSFQPNTHYNKGDYAKGQVYSFMSNIFVMVCTKEHTSGNVSYFTDDIDPETQKTYWDLPPGTSDTLFALGNGNYESSRSNALKIDWFGNGKFNGDLYVNCNADSTGGTKVATVADIPSVPVQDVQLNGTSLLNNGVANIPIAAEGTPGAVKVKYQYGLAMVTSGDNAGTIRLYAPADTEIKAGNANYYPVTTAKQHVSTFYGLAKAAGDSTQAASSNAVGTYTDSAKSAIRTMLSAAKDSIVAVQETQPTDTDTKIWVSSTSSDGIEVPTVAELEAGYVKKTDVATIDSAGIVRLNANYGLYRNDVDQLYLIKGTVEEIKTGTNNYKPIVPNNQHMAAFYGLAKAAGDSTQAASNNAIGTYTDGAKSAIRSMIGAVGPTDYANGTTAGVVKAITDQGIGINAQDGSLFVQRASDYLIKTGGGGAGWATPIVPLNQHTSVFYGLAKAAGDTTQSQSNNAVGTYTAEAKSAIQTMLGLDPASLASYVDIPLVETVSGATPTITGQPNVRYVCGEVTAISITPPASGTVDVVFESGTSPAVMTVPNTVKWPSWFDASLLETNTIYEVLITDGVYGGVMTWES